MLKWKVFSHSGAFVLARVLGGGGPRGGHLVRWNWLSSSSMQNGFRDPGGDQFYFLKLIARLHSNIYCVVRPTLQLGGAEAHGLHHTDAEAAHTGQEGGAGKEPDLFKSSKERKRPKLGVSGPRSWPPPSSAPPVTHMARRRTPSCTSPSTPGPSARLSWLQESCGRGTV
jgi:hypothetical protein